MMEKEGKGGGDEINEGEENNEGEGEEDAVPGSQGGIEAAAAIMAARYIALRYWLEDGDASDAAGNLNYDHGRAATEWLVNAVQDAHLSPTIKKAGRDLMACRNFTTNLEALDCWAEILMPKLKAALVALGDEAKHANAACNLAAVLTEEAILAIAPFNPSLLAQQQQSKTRAPGCSLKHTELNAAFLQHIGQFLEGSDRVVDFSVCAQEYLVHASNLRTLEEAACATAKELPPSPPPTHICTRRNAVRQDLLMPSLTSAVSTDYKRDWKQQPEHVYIHILLLLGTALDPLFGEALDEIASDLEGNVDVHTAPIKSVLRMLNKLRSKEDHQQVELQPRPAMNIDVVRRLAAAATGEDVLELARMVAVRFGGLSHLKCLPELATTDPAAADARFHMLPVMLTVVFAPAGLTVGWLLKDPAMRAKWAALRAVRPGNAVSTEQWQADHDAAVAAFERCDPNELVRMHCEVQVVTTATAALRKKMHGDLQGVPRREWKPAACGCGQTGAGLRGRDEFDCCSARRADRDSQAVVGNGRGAGRGRMRCRRDQWWWCGCESAVEWNDGVAPGCNKRPLAGGGSAAGARQCRPKPGESRQRSHPTVASREVGPR
jgi:hypothetical protein